MTRAIVSHMALNRIDRGNEVNFFLIAQGISQMLKREAEFSDSTDFMTMLEYIQQREDSRAISSLHVHANSKVQNNSGCEGTVLR